MTPTLESLGIDKLSLDERVVLVQEIWDSIDAETANAPLTEAQKRDIDRRLANHRASPSAARSWEDVEAELLARLRQ